MSLRKKPLFYFVAGFAIAAVVVSAIATKTIEPSTTSVDINKEGRPQYKWYAPELPISLSFAGEAVPLDRWEVKERLDRELLVNYYQHGSQLYILKLAGR
jgi:hypothetical protein